MAQEQLYGAVNSVTFASEDGVFSVFRMQPDGERQQVVVTVNAPAPLVGQQVEVVGSWVQHPRFGQQFHASQLKVSAPTSESGIERFLASGVVAGIGPQMARRIVAKFGKHALTIIEKHPTRLTEVAGIGKKTAEKIATSYNAQSELREIILWLEGHGVSGAYAGRIFKQYSSFAIDVLEKNPYRLVREVDGVGFLTADTIAAANGMERDSDERVAAGIDYALLQIALDGHCCLPEMQLIERAARLLNVDLSQVRSVLNRQLRQGQVAAETVGGEQLVYPAYLYEAECYAAKKLLELQREADSFRIPNAEELAREWEDSSSIALAEAQREAIEHALEHGIFVLTGGPGTGKTTVIRGMLDLLSMQGLQILLGAPTGRAAKRLAETTGRNAMTIHRMLEAQGGREMLEESQFARDEDEQLEADVIILDEVSMMDILLLRSFLEAVPVGCHVILVGDVDQLPSVGPGSVLKDILRSKVIPSIRLTEVFRQDEKSTIVLNAHAINAGRMPQCVKGSDFVFLASERAEDTAEQIVKICADYLPRRGYDALRDVQVLSPMHKQVCGVDNLNARLQEALNPPSPQKAQFLSASRIFRMGDKVMQTRNDYTKEVFNGDIGFIVSMEENKIGVCFAEEHIVSYDKTELLDLRLAYAMSVHKSQGSEYPVILLPLTAGHRIMLQRNLLYTAITRAKKLVILLGTKAALATAVGNDRTRKRYTLLAERLAEALT